MKKTDSTEEVSGLIVKGQKGRSKVGDLKMIQRLLAIFLLFLQEVRAHQEKLYKI